MSQVYESGYTLKISANLCGVHSKGNPRENNTLLELIGEQKKTLQSTIQHVTLI